MSEYCSRYPEVKLELRTGVGNEITNAVLTGTADVGIAIEPLPDAPFEKTPVYNEELVIVAAAGQPPIRSARDVTSRTAMVFEPSCPYRQRLEKWFALSGDMPERVMEITSYHAMLGCAVVGMGISLVPRMVLDTFPERQRLSIHPLPPQLNRAQTAMFWRKGARSPKLSALVEIVQAHAAGINAQNGAGVGSIRRKSSASAVRRAPARTRKA